MRVGIDVDYGEEKNLNRSQSRHDIIVRDRVLNGMDRVLDLLDSVYHDTRSALLAERGLPPEPPKPTPDALREQYILDVNKELDKARNEANEAGEYRVLVADLLGTPGIRQNDKALRAELYRRINKYRELWRGLEQLIDFEDDSAEYSGEEILAKLREGMGK